MEFDKKILIKKRKRKEKSERKKEAKTIGD